jgi:hypothetical protein
VFSVKITTNFGMDFEQQWPIEAGVNDRNVSMMTIRMELNCSIALAAGNLKKGDYQGIRGAG